MDSGVKLDIRCDNTDMRPSLGSKTLFHIFLDFTSRLLLKISDGDVHTVGEYHWTQHHVIHLDPHDNVLSVLRDKYEIDDDVSEALEPCISAFLEDFGSGGFVFVINVKVFRDLVDDHGDLTLSDRCNDRDDSAPSDLCEDHDDLVLSDVGAEDLPEISDSFIYMEYDDEEKGEEECSQMRETGAPQEEDHDVCDDFALSDLHEDDDDLQLPEISDSDIDLEEEHGLGMWDLDLDDYDMEEEEAEYIPRETGAPEDVIARLKKEGETQRQSPKSKLESADCVVCMEELSGSDMIIKMPCSHVFHQQCIFEWLQTRNTCPLCRRVPYDSLSSERPGPVPN